MKVNVIWNLKKRGKHLPAVKARGVQLLGKKKQKGFGPGWEEGMGVANPPPEKGQYHQITSSWGLKQPTRREVCFVQKKNRGWGRKNRGTKKTTIREEFGKGTGKEKTRKILLPAKSQNSRKKKKKKNKELMAAEREKKGEGSKEERARKEHGGRGGGISE